jgi:hypothetical protein
MVLIANRLQFSKKAYRGKFYFWNYAFDKSRAGPARCAVLSSNKVGLVGTGSTAW